MSNKTSRRTSVRISSALFVETNALPSFVFCDRCRQKSFTCYSLKDGRCSCCIRSGVEKKCNAKMSSRTDKSLKEQKEALRKAQSDAAEAALKVVRLQKIVDRLESKSREEFDLAMAEIERENSDAPGEEPSSSGGMAVESVPTEGGQSGVVPSSDSQALSDPFAGMSPGAVARAVESWFSPTGEFDRDYTVS